MSTVHELSSFLEFNMTSTYVLHDTHVLSLKCFALRIASRESTIQDTASDVEISLIDHDPGGVKENEMSEFGVAM